VADEVWYAVDWGTSNVRAWRIGSEGPPADVGDLPKGMGKITRADYPAVLKELIPARGAAGVLICGMAGARQGWMEAPYLKAPADLDTIYAAAVSSADGVRILPGVSQASPEDVMRGEETQLLGLSALRPAYAGPVIMPGTHSKWAWLEGGKLLRFSTAMTGELYDVLGTHSVLRHSLQGETMGPATEDGVAEGLKEGTGEPGLVTSKLFRARAAALLSDKGPDWCSGYLSGLLVGAEIGSHREWIGSRTIPLIGSPRLGRLYSAGLTLVGAAGEIIDATGATIAGLVTARKQSRP
jgi:2-dehydro-3-deoxygalactonokinase